MISRSDFDYGIDLIAGTFNRRIQQETRDTWFKLIAPDFSRPDWVVACNSTVRDEETFPQNFVRAMRSRAPKLINTETISVNPDTGKLYTPEDAHIGRQRLTALMQVMAEPRDNEHRKSILACAEASLQEGDSPAVRRKWGAHIERELDAMITPLAEGRRDVA